MLMTDESSGRSIDSYSNYLVNDINQSSIPTAAHLTAEDSSVSEKTSNTTTITTKLTTTPTTTPTTRLTTTFADKLEQLRAPVSLILKDKISNLRIISPVASKLLNLTSDTSSSMTELSRVMETEPSLSLEVLRLVNSSFYNLPQKIISIKHAVTLLGFSSIHQLAINQLFYKKMIRAHTHQKFDQIYYWQHSLFVATLSKTIAREIHHPEPELLYTAGLLHDIGKLILENHGRLSYSEFLLSFEKSDNASLENEQCFFGIDHATAGAVFCHHYQLPESISNIVLNHHHSLDTLDIELQEQQNIAIITYADFIAWLQKTGSDKHSLYPALHPEVLNIINDFNLDIEPVLEKVDKEIRDISKFYNIQFPSLKRLRSNLVETISHSSLLVATDIKNTIETDRAEATSVDSNNLYINSLMVPHHSLDPDVIIPQTLKAIHKFFSFDRLILLHIDPKQRSLVAVYWWPEEIISVNDKRFEIMISSLSGDLLISLRKRQPLLITNRSEADRQLLQKLQVDAFFSLPILNNKRLISVLYIDNAVSGKKLDDKMLSKLSIIATELGYALSNAKQFAQEKKRAQIDPLTRLNNRGMINQFLKTMFKKSKHQLKRLAVGFIDIDHFKMFNDNYGHHAGDDVLKIVSDIMKSLTRPGDFIGRYGGEEFLFILTDTDETGVKIYAERIRYEIEKKGKMLNKRFPKQSLTVSIGVTLYHPQYKTFFSMVDAADKAMYQSKENGRNKVTLLSSL